MNHWIFTVTKQKSDGSVLNAREIYETRMKDRFWGLGRRTANRRSLQAGDRGAGADHPWSAVSGLLATAGRRPEKSLSLN
jgi:hypothetical protein